MREDAELVATELVANVVDRADTPCVITICYEERQHRIEVVDEALPSVVFAPMGGVKQSGLGREGADRGLEEFTDVQYASFTL